jgi:hypothetical protein
VSSPPNEKPLSHIYREGAWPEPNRQIEQAIRATERGRRSFVRRWALPFALAAAALLVVVLVIRPVQEQPRPISESPPPASGAKVEQSPAIPDAQKAAVEADTQKATVKPDPQQASAKQQGAPASARVPAPPSPAATPPYAIRRDEAERLRLLQPDIGLKPGSPSSESPRPPPEPRAALKKELPERERAPEAPTFVPTRPPQAWIEDIRKLKAEGRAEEANRELKEFRTRYADFVLPEDLR